MIIIELICHGYHQFGINRFASKYPSIVALNATIAKKAGWKHIKDTYCKFGPKPDWCWLCPSCCARFEGEK